MDSINFKRSMKLFLKDMAVLYKGLPDLREDSQHGYQIVIADFTTLGESHFVWPSPVPLQTL